MHSKQRQQSLTTAPQPVVEATPSATIPVAPVTPPVNDLASAAAAAVQESVGSVTQAVSPVATVAPATVPVVPTVPPAVAEPAAVTAADAAANAVDAAANAAAAAANAAATAAEPVATAVVVSRDGGGPPLLTIAAGLALLPVGYLGANKFVEFVNERYDELTGGDSNAASAAPREAREFAPPPTGNVLANRMWRERAAELEAQCPRSWGCRGRHSALRAGDPLWRPREPRQGSDRMVVWQRVSSLFQRCHRRHGANACTDCAAYPDADGVIAVADATCPERVTSHSCRVRLPSRLPLIGSSTRANHANFTGAGHCNATGREAIVSYGSSHRCAVCWWSCGSDRIGELLEEASEAARGAV